MVQTFKAKFLGKEKLAKDVFLFKFELDKKLEFEAGQYLVLKVPYNEVFHRKMFSMVSTPDQKKVVEMIVKFYPHGIASTYLKKLKNKEWVEFEGPDGLFVLRKNNWEKVFVGLGTGLAPILSILRTKLPKLKEKTTLIWGQKTRKDLYLIPEIKSLAQKYPDHFQYFIALSQEGGKDARIKGGRVNKLIESMFPLGDEKALNKFDFYLCGDDTAVHSLRVWLNEKGVVDDNMIVEQFT